MLKNLWYGVELAERVGDEPLGLKVGGQDLVLWRDGSGEIVAQSDLCVHRGGLLSGGVVVDGCVRCPYHGWTFGPDGACTDIPANHEGVPIPKKARVDTYPCVERYGFVWVFLGDLPEEERPPLAVLDGLDDTAGPSKEGYTSVSGDFTWNANYERVVENAVDIAHTPFVHAGSFGNPDMPEVPDHEVEEVVIDDHLMSATATVDLHPPSPSGLWRYLNRGKDRPPVRTTTGLFMPNASMLVVRLPMGEIRIYTIAVPVDEHTTVSKFIAFRNFFTGGWADKNSLDRTLKVFREDQPTVEGQRPELLPFDLSDELHVKSDALQLAYRRWRREQYEKGWGIDSHRLGDTRDGAVVIPSPVR
ncbi:MAG: aromatic ring-hydroxylating dioxygenase subunit alpha, partial [Actinomycetota bacterium]